MPHVVVKCYPGRSDEQKTKLAEKIATDIEEIMGAPASSVSVAIEEVNPDNWYTQVWDNEIEPQMDTLYKKPGYTRK